jgi:TolB-like protein/Flp pilus assembly protein TadD
MSFLSELKRRRVVRVLVVYGAVAFAVIQGADVIAPALHLPSWFVTMVVLLALLGLPIAIVLAWAFEVTPDGVKRTEPVTRLVQDSATTRTSSPWLSIRTVVMAGVLVAAGASAGWLLKSESRGSDAARNSEAAPSLAVLPFENVGGEAAHAAFAIGLHDDLLTQLSRIGKLRLVSRTSVREYAGTTKHVRDIARELGVRTILEGSVQRDAQQIRINVQLIDGTTDEHLWAETYDKDLTVANLFAIQAEIAGAIANALRAELTGEARAEIANAPTTNLDAYDAYLRGLSRGYWDQQPLAAESFTEAVRLDPVFADAWAGAARARAWLARIAFDAGDLSRGRQQGALARRAAARAAELAAASSATKLAQGYVAYYLDWDLQRALSHFHEVQAAQPANAEVAIAIGQVVRRLGQWDDALAEFRRALALDQRNEDAAQELSQTQYYLGRFDDALRSAQIALEVRPGWTDAMSLFLPNYLGKGDTVAARRFVQQYTLPSDESSFVGPDPMLLVTHDRAAMQRRLQVVLDNTANRPPSRMYWVAANWAFRLGDRDLQHRFADSLRTRVEPLLRDLDRSINPRVQASLQSLTGLAHAYGGNPDAAVRHARRAVELVPPELDAIETWSYRDVLMEVLIVTGRYDEAVAFARDLLRPPSTWSVARLRTDPVTLPMRNHPAFRRLVGETK